MKPIIKFATFFLIAVFVFISCKKERTCEGCGEGNKPPILTAGTDQVITLLTDTVLPDVSSSSDPDGIISDWQEKNFRCPASFTFNNPAAPKTIVKNLIVGTYPV